MAVNKHRKTTSKAVHEFQADDSFHAWKIAGLSILAIRFVQAWIFWGGATRRFFYAPNKLNPHAAEWMANKIQAAMPGALLGFQSIISFLLQHFYLLYASIIFMSLVEFFCGIALMLGLFTRLAGLTTAGLSVVLMMIFGWQGSTCLDEWTMAVSNVSMGIAIALAGSSMYSMDSLLLHRYPNLKHRKWFTYLASGPLPFTRFKEIALLLTVFVIVFTLGTYDYYRGAIISRYRMNISTTLHHFLLTQGRLSADGSVQFNIYVDAGTPAIPAHIVRIDLKSAIQDQVVESWNMEQLSKISQSNINNEYKYNRFTIGKYGLAADTGARATIRLPSVKKDIQLLPGDYLLTIYSINGDVWSLPISFLRH